jgi:hypothetical protein
MILISPKPGKRTPRSKKVNLPSIEIFNLLTFSNREETIEIKIILLKRKKEREVIYE